MQCQSATAKRLPQRGCGVELQLSPVSKRSSLGVVLRGGGGGGGDRMRCGVTGAAGRSGVTGRRGMLSSVRSSDVRWDVEGGVTFGEWTKRETMAGLGYGV